MPETSTVRAEHQRSLAMRHSVSKSKSRFRQFVRRHFLFSAAIFLLIAGIGLTLTWFFPLTYQGAIRFRLAALQSGQVKPLPAANEEVQAQMAFWQSRQHLEPIVRQLNLSANEAGSLPVERAMDRLSKNLVITHDPNTGIISVQYRDRHSQRPTQVLQSLYKNFSEHLKIASLSALPVLPAPIIAPSPSPSVAPKAPAKTTSPVPVVPAPATPAPQMISPQQEQIAKAKDALLQEFYQTQSQINAVRLEIAENEKKIAALQLKLSTRSTATNPKEEKKSEESGTEEKPVEKPASETTPAPPQSETPAPSPVSAEASAAMDELVSLRTAQLALRNRERSLLALTTQYQAKMNELDQMVLNTAPVPVPTTQVAVTPSATSSPAVASPQASASPVASTSTVPAVPASRLLTAELVEDVTVRQKFPGIDWHYGVLLSLAGGLLAGFCAAFIRERRDPLIYDARLLQKKLGVEVLGTISESKEG
jgi:capsular polysaccharide biosynthesis protein